MISAKWQLHFFILLSNHSELLLEFIQTLANEGRNLEFMLHPNGNYVSPMVLLLGNKFTQHPSHKTHNIMLLTKIFSQSQFPKGNANDGFVQLLKIR